MNTLKDVAKLAGVSTATVSHVINGTRYVSEELQKKVNDAMKDLDYQPNMMARALKMGFQKTIGVIVPDCTNPFFAEISRAIDRYCFSKGYNIILCNTDNNLEQQASYTNMLISKHIDGVIFISSDNSDDEVEKFQKHSIPIVIADRIGKYNNVDSIVVDNEKGGYEATKYLINRGFTKIGCISGPSSISSSSQRVLGYKRALKEANITLKEEYISVGDFHFAGGITAADNFLKLSEKLEAVFATNDMMALGFIDTLRNVGLSVPKDISVIGYDNIQLAQFMSPKLTTVAQPLDKLAETATNLLLKKINKQNNSKEIIKLDPVIIERESCSSK
ncbi:MAG: LacI family DNA-binding transcriptional regulator [Pleomorphochaeta sp.]